MNQLARRVLSAPEGDSDFNLGALPGALWRRKRIILLTFVAGLMGAFAVISNLAPVYTASAQLMIAPQPSVLDVQSVAAALRGDAEDIPGEVYVLRSRDLALRVADKLALRNDPEFNPLLLPEPVSLWQMVLNALRPQSSTPAEAPGGGRVPADNQPPSPAAESPPLTPEQQRNLVASVLLSHLEAIPQGRSRVIALTAYASTPEKAATIANTVVEEYLASQVDVKLDTTENANSWLAARTRELEADVRTREAAVENYRASTGLLRGTGSERLSDEEASGLSTQLVQAQAEGAVAQARLKQIESLLAKGDATAVGDVLDAPLVRTLREQQASLHQELAQMSEEYGPRHPQVLNAQARLRDADRAIKSEVEKLVHSARNDAAVAAAREGVLTASLNALRSRNGRQSASEVKLRALEREAESSRTLLETFLARAKETAAQSTHALPDARIISRATAPFSPSYPNRQLLMVIAGAASLGAGLLLALLLEGMDRTVRTRSDLDSLLGIGALAALPLLGPTWRRRSQPYQWVLRAPRFEYSEALRRMHTELLLENLRDPPRIVLLTSALPSEGKTSTLLALGRLLAGTGKKVIAVDLNLRKPTLHRAAGLGSGAGIGEWFESADEASPQVCPDPLSGLRLLQAGRVRADPGVLLASARFAGLLGALRAEFDVVLLDSSPVLAVVDAQILASLVDATILLVRAGKTSRPSVAEAFALLARVAGAEPRVVLNASRRRESVPTHGHGLSAYYDESASYPARRPVRALPTPLGEGRPG